jgi:hypothetical protein
METTVIATYRQVRQYKREQRLNRRFDRQYLHQTRKSLIKAIRQCESIDKLHDADFVFRCENESASFSPFD